MTECNKTITIVNYKGDLRCRHFSLAVKNGKIITPILNNYSRCKIFNTIKGSMHAEMNVLNYIVNTRNLYNGYSNDLHKYIHKSRKLNRFFKKIDIIVYRVGNDDQLLESKPCSECIKVLKKFNVKGVYYSKRNGTICYERIRNIKSNHLSQLTRWNRRQGL